MLHDVQLLYAFQKGAFRLNLFINYEEAAAMILFAIGFTMLVFSKNIIKKILGLNIMDTAVCLLLTAAHLFYAVYAYQHCSIIQFIAKEPW